MVKYYFNACQFLGFWYNRSIKQTKGNKMINRQARIELQEQLAMEIVDGMDVDTLVQFVHERILENLEDMGDAEFLERVQEYHPHLLEN